LMKLIRECFYVGTCSFAEVLLVPQLLNLYRGDYLCG